VGANARSPHEAETKVRQIAAAEEQIDHLVYELYGLTDKEIRIVEEASGFSRWAKARARPLWDVS
jgi:hypothetical protein